ncbi:class I SAM-dependent methyltransferase [Hymenobacter wooponensis]|uniref:Class I SAM-dependent methyltransferase n=1 Tax=Hymenobacter wooponensis TaxID=1525360 RepID=A0A4Z0MDH0_9BACT|nr:class I SAM-dependent methyltransferase [Hymenobacter wooponensis]TGD77576.1 class I SAM-dependent methyltransferase [Hymenobacter wooponensis]
MRQVPFATPSADVANEVALELLSQTFLAWDAPLLDLGAGSSSFVPALLSEGYSNVVAVDVSPGALEAQAQQLTPQQRDQVLWVVDDVTQAQHLPWLDPILFWHDRAMLPVLTHPAHQRAYQALLTQMVLPRLGWVLLQVDRPGGGGQRGDMRTQPYTIQQLQSFVGPEFALQAYREYVAQEEAPQPRLYALFRRLADAAGQFRSA